MNLDMKGWSRSQVAGVVALGGSAGLIAILIARQQKKQMQGDAELRRLKEERVQQMVNAAKEKAIRDKRRRMEFDSPKALRRKEEEKRRKEEEARYEEQRRLEEEKRKAEEAARINMLQAMKMKAEEDARNKAFEEEWKRKAEEHIAKQREMEEQVQRAHSFENKAGGKKEAALQSAEAEAAEVEEELAWHKEEEAMIAKHHEELLGKTIRIHSTGELAVVQEIVDHTPLCKVVFAHSLEDGTDEVTVWASEDAIDTHPEVGLEVTVKTLKRIGHLSQVSNTEFPYKIQFSDGHSDLFRARDVDFHRVRGMKVRLKSITAHLCEFDESGTSCFVQFLTGPIAGETAWLDEDQLEAIPAVGCAMSVKSRNQRGELVKYDGSDTRMQKTDSWLSMASTSSSRTDYPYMVRLEDGSMDWYKDTDARPVFEVGATVTVTSAGLWDEITEPPSERPYQIKFCSGANNNAIGWARRINFSEQAQEGSPVKHRKSGRYGVIVKRDDSDIPVKVLYSDGALPMADWYHEDDLQVLPKASDASKSDASK